MLRMPPRMPSSASHAVTRPTGPAGRANVLERASAIALAWVRLPMPRDGAYGEQGEHRAKKPSGPPSERGLHHVHGATRPLAPVVSPPKAHSQHTLGKDGGHAKEGRELHPYQGPWPAGDQSRGYPHNIAGADGGCQGRHQGGEGETPSPPVLRLPAPARSAGHSPAAAREETAGGWSDRFRYPAAGPVWRGPTGHY